MTGHRTGRSIVAAGALLAAGPVAAAGGGGVARFGDPGLPAVARGVEVGGALRVDGVPLFAGEAGSALELQRFRVFAPAARIAIHGPDGTRLLPPPARADFAGAVAGEPGSLAFLTAGEGGLRGLVVARGRGFAIAPRAAGPPSGGRAPAPPWTIEPLEEPEAPAGASCGAGDLPALSAAGTATGSPAPDAAGGDGRLRAAEVAVETDWELFQKLGSAAAVADYAGDLFGVASAIYQRDVDTLLQVVFLSLWPTPADPFEVTTGSLPALHELADYWHAAHPDLPRTIVHLLSGRDGIQGGIAYHGVLCTPDTPVGGGHWGGGYALSGALVSSGMLRDSFIMSHEIGHNFRSHHTHCYNDLPLAGDPPIDRCHSGEIRNDGHPCHGGATSLPADGGSIMSYCHLQPGGYANVTLSLGEEGRFGERSERVLERMFGHILSVGCLVDLGEPIFLDGFESGDTSSWSGST